jgi:translocator protein
MLKSAPALVFVMTFCCLARGKSTSVQSKLASIRFLGKPGRLRSALLRTRADANDVTIQSQTNNKDNAGSTVDFVMRMRGGGDLYMGEESNTSLFAKVGIGALLETVGMLTIIALSRKFANIAPFLPKILGLSLFEFLSVSVIIFGSSFIGGGVSAATSQTLRPNVVPGDPNWYSRLKKPSWNPPGWLFPIMWLIVSKPTQLIAAATVLRQRPSPNYATLAVYCTHLALGDAWNKVFFEYQSPGRGAAVIVGFYSVLLASAYLFYLEEPGAGLLLLPTVGWVTVATALNWSIYILNKE